MISSRTLCLGKKKKKWNKKLTFKFSVSRIQSSDDATIVDMIKNAPNAPPEGSREFKTLITKETNKVRKVVPELHEAVQQVILDHPQSSNKPELGNRQFVSNFVVYDDIEAAIHTPCQDRIKYFFTRFYRADGFIVAAEEINRSLGAMELGPEDIDPVNVNSFERFLQKMAFLINNVRN